MGYGIFGQKITGIRDIKAPPLMGPPAGIGHICSRKWSRRYIASEKFAQSFPTLFHIENKELFSGNDGLTTLFDLAPFWLEIKH